MYDEQPTKKPTGTLKTSISQFTVNDPEVSRIITRALTEAGFDVISKPVREPRAQYFIGEELEVYRTEVVR